MLFRGSEKRPSTDHVLRSIGGLVAALSLALGAARVSAQEADYPVSVSYSGEAQTAEGRPLEGRYEVEVRYFDKTGARQLWSERFALVDVAAGRFVVELGRGQILAGGARQFASLHDLFAANYQVELDFSFAGRRTGRGSPCCLPDIRSRRG